MTENEYFTIDYSGSYNWEKGVEKIKDLENFLDKKHQPHTTFKLLFDARKFINDVPETHMALTNLSRKTFGKKTYKIKLAVLHSEYNYILNEYEAWFIDEDKAINWLEDNE